MCSNSEKQGLFDWKGVISLYEIQVLLKGQDVLHKPAPSTRGKVGKAVCRKPRGDFHSPLNHAEPGSHPIHERKKN